MKDYAYDKMLEIVTDIHKRHPRIKALTIPRYYHEAYERNKYRFNLPLTLWIGGGTVSNEFRVIPNNTLITRQ